MTEDAAALRMDDRGGRGCQWLEPRTTKDVDTGVQRVQLADLEPMFDRRRRKLGLEELTSGDDASLELRDPSNLGVAAASYRLKRPNIGGD